MPRARAGLTREVVLDAAMDLVDREGLGALTMRRLGVELGVEAMSLYHHVRGKDALLDGLVERVLEQAAPLTGAGWDAALRAFAWSLRATLLRHPGVLPLAVTRPAVTPATLHTVEQGLRMLRAAGFPLGRALDVLNALTVFVVGHAAAEIGTTSAHGSGSAARLATLDAEEFPLLVTAAREEEGTDDEARFRFAVDAMLAGFAVAATG
jgi:AcrR family transcriptional regulator